MMKYKLLVEEGVGLKTNTSPLEAVLQAKAADAGLAPKVFAVFDKAIKMEHLDQPWMQLSDAADQNLIDTHSAYIIGKALRRLHNLGIAHCDCHGYNVFLRFENGTVAEVKFIDFEHAKEVPEEELQYDLPLLRNHLYYGEDDRRYDELVDAFHTGYRT